MMKHRTDSVRRMPPAKRLLAAALSLLMAFSVLPLLAGVLILPVSASVTAETDLPTFTFYVPETLYLSASDNKTVQYYVDREQSVGGELTKSAADTDGSVYFKCDGATSVNSLIVGGASFTLSATSSNTGELKATATGGSLSSSISMNSVTVVPWTVTFTYNGVQYSATAYSTAYAPNRNVTANGITGYDNNMGEGFASGLIWIQGAQTTRTGSVVYQDGSSDHRTNYQNTSGRTLDPMVNGVTQPDDYNPHDYGNTSSGAFTGATASFTSCYCVREDDYDGDGQWVMHVDCNRTPAEVIVDTSRYSNVSQLPNLKLGYMVTDWKSCSSRRNWYVSDATSAVSNPNSSNPSLSFTWKYGKNNETVDLLKHSRWKKDDFCKNIYNNGYGTILRHSGGGSTPSLGGETYHSGENIDGYNDDVGKKYLEPISAAVSGTGSTSVRYYRGAVTGNNGSAWPMSSVMVLLKITTVNKTSLRNLVNECVGQYMNGYYTDASWNAYNTALQNACSVLGNPAADASAISTAETNLSSAASGLVRGTGTATVTHKSSTGATIATETKNYSYGDTVTVAANTYNGYTYVSADPAETTRKNVTTNALSWTLTYDPIEYGITYDLGGGADPGNPASYNVETAAFVLQPPTWEGHNFLGWSGTGVTGTSTSVLIPKGSYGDRSYTAHWEAQTFTVTFKDWDDNVLDTQTVEYGQNAVPPTLPEKAPDAAGHYIVNDWAGYTNIKQDTVVTATYRTFLHHGVMDPAVPATCTETGLSSGRHCSDCGYVIIAQLETPVNPNNHDYSVFVRHEDATCVAGGYDVYKCSRCGAETNLNVTDPDPNAHDFSVLVETVAPTCSAGGYDVYRCSRCDATTHLHETPADPSRHNFSVYVVTVPATCVAGGYDVYKCAYCDATTHKNETEINPDAHDFSVYVETVPATCVAGGYDVYKCSRCDATTEKNNTEINANNHDFSVYVETVTPTCVAGGYDVYKCSRCDATTHLHETEIDPDAHDFSVYVETVTPTCVAGGYDTYKCSRCDATTRKNETLIDPEAHDFSVFVERIAPTCVAGGYDTYKCSRCDATTQKNETEIDPDAHDFSVFVERITPTCVAGGYDTYKCSRCDATTRKNETEIDPNAHDFSVYVETVTPTCVAGGYDTYKCSRCDATTHKNETEIDPDAHDFTVFVERIAPTCVAGGYDTYKCSRCDATTQKNETEIDPDAHDFTEFVERIAPTCVAGGYDVYKCSRCDATTHKNETEIDPDAHDFAYVETVEPTCNVGGYDLYQCSRCGATEQRNPTQPDETKHVFGDWTVALEPKCNAEGKETRTCSVCGKVEERSIPMTDHTPGEAVISDRVEPTCAEEGSYHIFVRCTVCNTVLSDETRTIEKLPHTPGEAVITNRVEPTCAEEGSYHELVLCKVCGETLTDETKSIPKLPHTAGEIRQDELVAPTCTEEGSYWEVTLCAVCGQEMRHRTVMVRALGHEYGEWTVTEEPTCTETGERVSTCVRCGEPVTDVAPALGHDWGAWEVVIAPDYGVEGLQKRVCSRCDAEQTQRLTIGSNRDRGIQFVGGNNVKFTVYAGENTYVYNTNDARVLEWYSGASLRFDVEVTGSWAGDGYAVLVNQQPLAPNADGSYTIPAGRNYLIVSVMPLSSAEDPGTTPSGGGSGSGVCKYCGQVHGSSFWGRLVAFFHLLAYFFLHLFGRA